MKQSSGTSTEVGEPKAFSFLQVAIPFAVTLVVGGLVTAVLGLFVYANSSDPQSRDVRFTVVSLVGLAMSIVAAYIAARRTKALDPTENNGAAFSLLKKYRRSVTRVGADAQAGQHSIGESYLRELLGRRGA